MTGLSEVMEGDDDAPMQMPRKKRGEEEMDITPMIDITFLLLIFFVVASKMDPTQTAQTPYADAGDAVAADDSVIIFIERGTGENAIIRRQDETTFTDDPDAQVSEIVDYVQEKLEEERKQRVMILGNFDAPVGEVGRVRKILGDNFEQLNQTYLAVKEE